MGDRTDKTHTEKDQPFDRATGQVERSTQDLSEREQAKSRQADLRELAASEADAEGEALPDRDPDSGRADPERPGATQPRDQATENDGSDDDDRASSTAKPITAHNSE